MGRMKRAAEEVERRRPVWEAMSAFFLDTEIDEKWLGEIVATLLVSGYSVEELERILWGEVCPVLWMNTISVAGEWAGFDMGEVERRILARPAGRARRWWAYWCGGRMVRGEWERVRGMMTGRVR